MINLRKEGGIYRIGLNTTFTNRVQTFVWMWINFRTGFISYNGFSLCFPHKLSKNFPFNIFWASKFFKMKSTASFTYFLLGNTFSNLITMQKAYDLCERTGLTIKEFESYCEKVD